MNISTPGLFNQLGILEYFNLKVKENKIRIEIQKKRTMFSLLITGKIENHGFSCNSNNIKRTKMYVE